MPFLDKFGQIIKMSPYDETWCLDFFEHTKFDGGVQIFAFVCKFLYTLWEYPSLIQKRKSSLIKIKLGA